MGEQVFVHYTRESPETFSGEATGPDGWRCIFGGTRFEGVLEIASVALKQFAESRLVMKRGEAPYAMEMPSDIETLLRTDLPAAIQALTIQPQRVVVGEPRKCAPVAIRSCSDTLADALGDEIYLRTRAGGGTGVRVESPISGRWAELPSGNELDIRHYTLAARTVGQWLVVPTEQLLGTRLVHYYLPRLWNPSNGWITHTDLASMYEAFKKEKRDAESK